MNKDAVRYLVCPGCRGDLHVGAVRELVGETILDGDLSCAGCSTQYPVVRGVPRFVPRENYASSFGLEWTTHSRTQFDGHSGSALSRKRFFEETSWPERLEGEVILEVGSGSGRFTEQAASTGAFVVSLDYSYAVEANYASNGHRPNVLIVQADVYRMPVREASFDRVFCIGVLQHTPDPHAAFRALIPPLKPGGDIVIDVYKKTLLSTVFATKYYVRPFTRRMDPQRLYAMTRRWVDLMWPVANIVRKIPKLGPSLNWRLLIPDYSRDGLQGDILKEWAYLDTFDMLGPRYDAPQTLRTIRRWFEEARIEDSDIRYGYNGIQGRGRRRRSVTPT